VVELNLFDTPDAGSDATLTLCNLDLQPFDLLGSLGGTPFAGGTWVDPSGTVHDGSFDPATDLEGSYTYTLAGLPPCPSASSVVSVSLVGPVPNGQSEDISLCSNADPVTLLDAFSVALPADGVWTGPGGTAMNGVFTPGQSGAGIYTYTLQGQSPCPNGIHTLNLIIETLPNAGADGQLSLCSSSGPSDLLGALGGSPDVGGTWTDPSGTPNGGSKDPSSALVGFYTYSVAGAGPCPGDQADVEVSITDAPNSGAGGVVSLCTTGPITDPFDWLSGSPDLTGVWEDPSGATTTSFDPSTAGSGTYTYTVPGSSPCPDAQTTVNVILQAPPNAGDDGTLEICAEAAPIDLSSAISANGQGGGTWYGPSGNGVTQFNPAVDLAGAYSYSLQGSGACSDELDKAVITISVLPTPSPSFTNSVAVGCAPLQVQFLAENQPELIIYQWALGDGNTGLGPDTWYTYDAPGAYDVTLTVTDANGCTGSVTNVNAVQVSGGPSAQFALTTWRISVEDPEFSVEHAPDPLVSYEWTFNGDSIDVIAPFTWTVPGAQVGYFPVCLIATDSLGCSNESCLELLIDDVMTIYVPNAFTPNGDGANEVFLPSILGIDPATYSLLIVDRWGIPVFSSTDPTVPWDGSFNNGGEFLPQDVYVWQLVARDQFSADRREYKGSVTLLK